jgi:uncharacterized NAD(P)/FAD-binding protein YdhS
MASEKCVTIIGGGFSGTLTAVQLLRQSPFPVCVRLINAGYPVGRGVAYSAESTLHLLNVRAGRMSAFPHLPRHFVNWLENQPQAAAFCEPGQSLSDAFMPRRLYGNYVEQILSNTLKDLPAGSRLEILEDEVTGITLLQNKKYELTLKEGGELVTDKVVLALGNFTPEPVRGIAPKVLDSDLYKGNPWLPGALTDLDPEQPVLLIGTGLTMVDVVLSLLQQNFPGQILAVSPKGYLPMVHLQSAPYSAFKKELTYHLNLNELFSRIKAHIKKAEAQGSSCEALIDSLRPKTQELWQNLSFKDKQKFMRHLSSLWGVFRHRLAPQIASRIQEAREAGRLEIIAGRLRSVTLSDKGLDVNINIRGKGKTREVQVQRLVNCTGPLGNYSKIAHPLVQQLLHKKLALPHPLHLGLKALPDGRLLQEDDLPSCSLFTIGPALRGALWESTAVPEISEQAAQLAQTIIHAFFPD